MSASVAASLSGKSQEQMVAELLRLMLAGHNEEVTSYLKSLPVKEASEVRTRLVRTLETKQRRKSSKKSGSRRKSSSKEHVGSSSRRRRSSKHKHGSGGGRSSSSRSGGGSGSGGGGGNSGADASAAPSPSSENINIKAPKDSAPKVKRVGKYQMGELLGKGGFAKVFRALDADTGAVVAIKEINRDLLSAEELPKIMKEAELLQKLDHPNIVKFYELIETDKQIYFVIEYIEGGSLYSILKKFGLFPEPLIVVYLVQVLRGLEYLHKENVLHRDIKGANLLLTKDGRVKLADFGACTYAALDKRLTVIGTPFWMAPEIIEMSSGGTKADIWSLACTVIELLTGNPPYYSLGSMQALFKMVDDDHPPIPEGVSEEMQHFLLACFIKDVHKRPDAGQLLEHPWIKKHEANAAPSVDPSSLSDQLKPVSGDGGVDIAEENRLMIEKQAAALGAGKEPVSDESLRKALAKAERRKEQLEQEIDDLNEIKEGLEEECRDLAEEEERLKLRLQALTGEEP